MKKWLKAAFGDSWKYTVVSTTNMTWAVRQLLWSSSNTDSGLSAAVVHSESCSRSAPNLRCLKVLRGNFQRSS
jgi:hypothetical protein